MAKQIMVTVPYEDFVDGICAIAELEVLRGLIESKQVYCSDEIRAVLGLKVDSNAGAD